jgi:hypothetical protein
VQIGNSNDDSSTCDTTHAQDTSQRGLCAYIHLQVPHQEDWQYAESKVTACGSYAVNVGNGDNAVKVHTTAVGSASGSFPEKGNGVTLQSQHEPEDEANDCGHSNNTPKNRTVQTGNSKTEKGDGD